MSRQFSLSELSEITEAELVGDPDVKVSNVNSLEKASAQDVSFLANPLYTEKLKVSNAGVICIDRGTSLVPGKNFLISPDPSRTFQLIMKTLRDAAYSSSGFQGIHPSAVIHPSAKIGKDVTIHPYVVVDAHSEIGAHTQIFSFVSIGPNVKIGKRCTLYSGATIREECCLGDEVVLQPGAIIGSCGFGLLTDSQTGCHTKLEQMGNVVLEDGVEIGANTTIDRARFGRTCICAGAKIDNLVQIGHNVHIGKNTIIVAQVGIAGSTEIGNNVCIGGQVGIVGHISIVDGVTLAARSGVVKTIKEPGIYGGAPSMPQAQQRRVLAHILKLERLFALVKNLIRRVGTLEKTQSGKN